MPQSLSKLYVHLVFSTKGRRDLIPPAHMEDVHAYLAAVLEAHGCHVLAIGGTSNHVHILMDMARVRSLAELVRLVKSNSSRWLCELAGGKDSFGWQAGYAAFSISKSHVGAVCAYISDQQRHHEVVAYDDEFRRLCKIYDMAIDERYAWD